MTGSSKGRATRPVGHFFLSPLRPDASAIAAGDIELQCNGDIRETLKSLDDGRRRFELLNAVPLGEDDFPRISLRR